MKNKNPYPAGTAPAMEDAILSASIAPEAPEIGEEVLKDTPTNEPPIGDDWVPPYDDVEQ